MTDWEKEVELLFPVVVSAEELTDPAARSLAKLLTSGIYAGGRLLACRMPGSETRSRMGRVLLVLVVELDIELGQRPVENDIRPVERVAFAFFLQNFIPFVVPLRPDFPKHVPHLNISVFGEPRSLCLFDMPHEEVLRIATPVVLLDRVKWWLTETAHGRLQGDEQPLEPLFLKSRDAVVLPDAEGVAGHTGVYCGVRASDRDEPPIFLRRWSAEEAQRTGRQGFPVLMLATRPLLHGDIQAIPTNVGELLTCFDELGVDMLALMRAAIRGWVAKGQAVVPMSRSCLIVVRTPIVRPNGAPGRDTTKAFMTECAAGVLSEKLGALLKVGDHYAPPLVPPDFAASNLTALRLAAMDVYHPFDRPTAQAASGIDAASGHSRQVTLIGAGALGSQLAMTAARMGLGTWTIVDPDFLMPHNLARHALGAGYAGWAKADALSHEMMMLLGDEAATAVVGMIPGEEGEKALPEAELVIDASASVPVARWLAVSSKHANRTVSAFLNPSGCDLVMLMEGEARTPRLDHVEMSYYWKLANDPDLKLHLSGSEAGIYPSGGCRRPSLRLPQANIGVLAALAAKRLLQDAAPADGLVEIRMMSDDGVTTARSLPERFHEAELDGWTVCISDEVVRGVFAARTAAGGAETGGILVGTWDRVRRHAYVVGHHGPPLDSLSEPSSFVRGECGVYMTLAHIEESTGGNLTYVGEWHTHPPGYSSKPSVDDKVLLRWIEDVLAFSDVPPLMAIVGEDGLRLLMGPDGRHVLFERSTPVEAA